MPLQNRMSPMGQLHRVKAKGLLGGVDACGLSPLQMLDIDEHVRF